MELLSPKVDFVFKRIFGAEENKDVLVNFLNAVFEDSGEQLVADVEILNPFLNKEALSDLAEIHFIELPKLREQAVGLERRLVRWMLFFTAKTKEQLEGLAMGDPAIKKALTTLEFLSQDEEARRLYEERMKGLQTYLADMEGARQEGREEGRKEGGKEGDREARRALAKNFLGMGLTVEQVAKGTGLTRNEVEAIRREMEDDQ